MKPEVLSDDRIDRAIAIAARRIAYRRAGWGMVEAGRCLAAIHAFRAEPSPENAAVLDGTVRGARGEYSKLMAEGCDSGADAALAASLAADIGEYILNTYQGVPAYWNRSI
jgi:hypothetical protein